MDKDNIGGMMDRLREMMKERIDKVAEVEQEGKERGRKNILSLLERAINAEKNDELGFVFLYYFDEESQVCYANSKCSLQKDMEAVFMIEKTLRDVKENIFENINKNKMSECKEA